MTHYVLFAFLVACGGTDTATIPDGGSDDTGTGNDASNDGTTSNDDTTSNDAIAIDPARRSASAPTATRTSSGSMATSAKSMPSRARFPRAIKLPFRPT